MTTWAVKDENGQILTDFLASSRIQVGCKVLPIHYDVFRLHVSASYRELFERALRLALEKNHWQIIAIKRGKPPQRYRPKGKDDSRCLKQSAASAWLNHQDQLLNQENNNRRRAEKYHSCEYMKL